MIALRSSGYLESAGRRTSPWIPTFFKTFARRLSYRSDGPSNLLSIRVPLLSLELIDTILWAVLFALYAKWIPKTRGLDVYVFHGAWEPPSGYDTSITFMLVLVGHLFAPTTHHHPSDKLRNPGYCLFRLDLLHCFPASNGGLSASSRILYRFGTPVCDDTLLMWHCGILVE